MNRLAHERSPYLLQHAENPVDWYPWGNEAFNLARSSSRPLLVSVGYSACHWCHVMEHESFSDPAVASQMNRDFVCVKVDREERPDIDAMCMSAVQTLTGSGGWPTTLFLTPDGRPFWGGTYFPPQPRHGLPSFSQLLDAIATAWRDKRDECESAAGDLLERLGAVIERSESPSTDSVMLENAADAIISRLDRRSGGFGGAPKFPQPTTLDFLLNVGARTGRCEFTEGVELTLRKMAAGGIHDQLGGGFHRYATDAHWQVPHFEKMLYDNALLARSYARAWGVTGDPLFRRVAHDTFAFLLRDMRDPLGGFYSALDADSEGVEGRHYVWAKQEFDACAATDAVAGAAMWGVSEGGNWEGTNILNQAMRDDDVATKFGVSADELRTRLRTRLLPIRDRRIRPGLDDKVVACWNGLMLSALSEGATALGDDALRQSAIDLACFLRDRMVHQGRVSRCWRNGEAYGVGMLEDQAALADGLISLYECTYDAEWFELAVTLADGILEHFTTVEGGFTDSPRDGEVLAVRPDEPFDSPLPAGRSLAASAFLRLHGLTGDSRYRDALDRLLADSGWLIERMPGSAGAMALVADVAAFGIVEVAVAGPLNDPRTRALLGIVESGWHPGAVRAAGTDARVPLLSGRVAPEPSFHLCRRHECGLPVTSPSKAEALWRGSEAWHPPHPSHLIPS